MAKNNSPARTVKGVKKVLKAGVRGEYSAGGGLYLSVNGAGSVLGFIAIKLMGSAGALD
jgi:hypothetical protein